MNVRLKSSRPNDDDDDDNDDNGDDDADDYYAGKVYWLAAMAKKIPEMVTIKKDGFSNWWNAMTKVDHEFAQDHQKRYDEDLAFWINLNQSDKVASGSTWHLPCMMGHLSP